MDVKMWPFIRNPGAICGHQSRPEATNQSDSLVPIWSAKRLPGVLIIVFGETGAFRKVLDPGCQRQLFFIVSDD